MSVQYLFKGYLLVSFGKQRFSYYRIILLFSKWFRILVVSEPCDLTLMTSSMPIHLTSIMLVQQELPVVKICWSLPYWRWKGLRKQGHREGNKQLQIILPFKKNNLYVRHICVVIFLLIYIYSRLAALIYHCTSEWLLYLNQLRVKFRRNSTFLNFFNKTSNGFPLKLTKEITAFVKIQAQLFSDKLLLFTLKTMNFLI